jgi:chemotaxis-related protein WspB
MLILGVSIGNEQYGIEAIRVIEVVPLIALKKVPLADVCIKGLFNYRGQPTPVIDLCQLFEQSPCSDSLSTRIVIVNYQQTSGTPRAVGFIAEHITDVMRCQPDDMRNSGIADSSNDFLGLIYSGDNGMVQLIDTDKILPESISRQLMQSLDQNP